MEMSRSWQEDFCRHLETERNASEHTVDAYRRDIAEFGSRIMENENFTDWGSVDNDQARLFVMKLFDAGDAKRTIRRKLSALRSFYRFLIRHGKLEDNPFSGLAPIKSDKPLPVVMSISDIDRLITGVKSYWEQAAAAGLSKSEESAEFAQARDTALIELIYSGGLRISEAVGADLGDLDLHNAVVLVRGKGKKERMAALGSQAVRLGEGLAEGLIVEVGVVAEAAVAAGIIDDESFGLTTDCNFPSVGVDERDTANEAGGALLYGQVCQVLEQKSVIGGIVAVSAGIAGRVDPGPVPFRCSRHSSAALTAGNCFTVIGGILLYGQFQSPYNISVFL